MKPFFYDWTLPDWQDWVREAGLPAYRAPQIWRWQARGVSHTDEMTDLPAAVRRLIDEQFTLTGFALIEKSASRHDPTTKYLFGLPDGQRVETVRMHYKYGISVCVSSQAGCRMGCRFCASAEAGFGRGLSAGEMLAQVARVGRDAAERVSRVTVMGIGEPLDNYDQLIRFLHAAHHPEGLGISMRRVSVSTCGLVPEMLRFTDEDLPVALSISLHAPNDEIRRQLMPVARRYPMEDVLAACRRHAEISGRRIEIEYVLLRDLNDRSEHATELAGRLRGLLCHVNLISFNEIPGSHFQRSEPEVVEAFRRSLEQNGITATVRRELGSDILAACGQLRRSRQTCASS